MGLFYKLVHNKYFCLLWCFIGCGYMTWYGYLMDPGEYTASMIGLEHPWLFKLWGLLMSIAFALNITYMYRKYRYKGLAGKRCIIAAAVCIAICVHIPSTRVMSLQLVSHWTMALSFAALNAIAIALLLLNKAKVSKLFSGTLIAFVGTLALMIILLIIFGKRGDIENIPMWGAYLILFLVNYTNLYKIKEPVNKSPDKEKEVVTS